MILERFGLFAAQKKEFSWWWFGVKLGAIAALIVWWWIENQEKINLQLQKSIQPEPVDQEIPLPETDVKPMDVPVGIDRDPVPDDDLKVIEGIGPKIASTLQAAGISTFVQLAGQTPEVLKQILVDGGVRIGYPETWSEQAALAAKGDWDALEAFQSNLKGGRRPS